MKCSILHSLQDMAALKIAIRVFYDGEIENMLQDDRNDTLTNFSMRFNCNRHELWKLIQMKVVEKLSFLPDLLQTKVYSYIQPLHIESEDWIKIHRLVLNLDPSHCHLICKKDFCWKSDGIINRVETAKKIVQNKDIDPNTRFILACNYFLEDEILAIWHGDEEVNKKSLRCKGTNSAVRFWIKWLRKGSVTPWRLMVDDYFAQPCYRRLDIPLRFSSFFPYLSQESRWNYFHNFNYGDHSFDKDEFFLCMCKLDEAERTELLQLIPQSALLYCLKWPFQALFIEIVNQLEGYKKDYDFELIYLKIVSFIMNGFHDFDYAELLREFWNLSPSFKEEIKYHELYSRLLEAILNYDENNQSLSLVKVVKKCIYEYYHDSQWQDSDPEE